MSVIDEARSVAESILARLSTADVGWRVVDVSAAGAISPSNPHLKSSDELLITIKSRPSGHRVLALFATHVPFDEAVVGTADQIQDGVVEARQGVALPACPGHVHPLSARLIDGEPSWVCPRSEEHHREPILGARDDQESPTRRPATSDSSISRAGS